MQTPARLVLALAGALAAGPLAAQTFPVKPIRVVNPAAPGGNSDIVFRLLSPKMHEVLGQPLVMDYRAGAGGQIGLEITAKSPPDGYTTAIAAASFLINPALSTRLPFDTIKDFTPLGLIVDLPAGLVVHPSLPVKQVKDLIALAQARPGELFFSSAGPGALGHLTGELFNATARVKLTHVPYKGAGPSVIELIAGHVHLSFVSLPLIMEHVRGGKLRLLAQCGAKRSAALPDAPTMQEAGVPGFVVSSGFSLLGPAAMPRPIVERLNSALVQALRHPPIRKELVDRAADPVGSTPEEHAAYIRSEVDKWQRVARTAGIKPE